MADGHTHAARTAPLGPRSQGQTAGFSASTAVDRKDLGLEWNASLVSGGVLVADKVKIALEIEAAKAA